MISTNDGEVSSVNSEWELHVKSSGKPESKPEIRYITVHIIVNKKAQTNKTQILASSQESLDLARVKINPAYPLLRSLRIKSATRIRKMEGSITIQLNCCVNAFMM
jgi:hypothetical protein